MNKIKVINRYYRHGKLFVIVKLGYKATCLMAENEFQKLIEIQRKEEILRW